MSLWKLQSQLTKLIEHKFLLVFLQVLLRALLIKEEGIDPLDVFNANLEFSDS